MDVYHKYQQKRLRDINFFLNKMDEPDITDIIIKKINKRFPKTKYYTFIRPEELYEGILIKTVSLDLTKMNITGKILEINKENGSIVSAVLFNAYKVIKWTIKPQKYYIFKYVSDDEIHFKELHKDLLRILNK
jgi:hypothetical protein